MPRYVSVFVSQVVAKGTTDAKWNKRFFRLTDAFLLYYRNPEAKAPAGWCVLLFHPEDAPSLSAAADAVLGELQNHLLANAAPLLLHRDGPPPPLATGAVSCTGPLLQVELTAAVPQACYSVGGLRVAGFEVTARVSLRAGAQARTMAALGRKKAKAG